MKAGHSMLDECALISRLEEENAEMLQEIIMLEQQQLDLNDDTTGQFNGFRERTIKLEAKMREKQQTRRIFFALTILFHIFPWKIKMGNQTFIDSIIDFVLISRLNL